MCNLNILPEHLIVTLLTGWLDYKSLPHLDVALCNSRSREQYLQCLRDKGTVFQLIDSMGGHSLPTLMEWIADRGVRVTTFNLRRLDCVVEVSTVRAFWSCVGDTLVDLYIERLDARLDASMRIAAKNITRLRHLHVETSLDVSCTALPAILQNCAGTLINLTLVVPNIVSFDLPAECMMTALRALRLQGQASNLFSQCPILRSFLCPDLHLQRQLFTHSRRLLSPAAVHAV
jgi:hypothetical protein